MWGLVFGEGEREDDVDLEVGGVEFRRASWLVISSMRKRSFRAVKRPDQ